MSVTWDDGVNRVARTDHRSARQIGDDLLRAAARLARYPITEHPRERRRIAGCVLREAIAAYLLAGGDPEHLDGLAELIERHQPGPPVRGPVGARALLARARLELLDERAVSDEEGRVDVDERIEDVDLRAAGLERPGRWPAPGPDAVMVSTPGELAAARIDLAEADEAMRSGRSSGLPRRHVPYMPLQEEQPPAYANAHESFLDAEYTDDD